MFSRIQTRKLSDKRGYLSRCFFASAVVLGDNAHVTDKLYQFATRTGRKFLFFQQKPLNHWYPGAGIGAAYGTER